MRAAVVLVLAGCGRIAFDATGDAGGRGDGGTSDGTSPDVMMIDPVGQLDPSFGGTGLLQPSSAGQSIGYDIIPRGSGYLVVGVDYGAVGGPQTNVIALKEGGALDPSWAGTGELFVKAMSATTSFSYDIHPLPNGDVLFIGDADATGTDDMLVSHFDQAGVFAPSFGGIDGFVTYNINPPGNGGDTGFSAVTVNGITYVCGIGDYSGDIRFAVIAIDPDDGTLSSTFQTGGMLSGQYSASADECKDITTDGTNLWAVGQYNGVVGFYRLDLTGTATPLMNPLRSGAAETIERTNDGKFLIAGFDGANGFILRMTSLTGFDSTFAGDGSVDIAGDTIDDLVIDSQGRIVAVGRRASTYPVVRRFLSDGSVDSSFGTNGAFVPAVPAGDLRAVMLDARGRIVAVGHTDDGTNRLMVLRLL